jgi:hypothetical protein
MKLNSFFLPTVAVLALTVATASADFTSISFSGPGLGQGNNPLTSGFLTEPSLIFEHMDYIDVTMTVDSAGDYNFNQAPLFGGTSNSTGQTWTGFDILILSGGVGTFTDTWSDYPGGLTPLFSPTHLVFSGENVPTSSNIGYVGHFTTTGPGTVILRETPLIPEPSSLAFLGLGIAGCCSLLRRRGAVG